MSELIDSSSISVIKDSDNISQDILSDLVSDNIDVYYTSGYEKVSHTVHIYLKLDKPMYITKIEIYCPDIMPKVKTFYLSGSKDDTFSSEIELINGTRTNTNAEYVPFEIESNNIKKFQYYDLYFTSAYKPASAGSQYYVKYRAKIKLYGVFTMPQYLLKDIKDNKYYTKGDSGMLMLTKDEVTTDNMINDLSILTKENLGLINNPYKVMIIEIP